LKKSKAVGGLLLTAAGVLAFAVPASAHVTISPNTAAQGSETKLTFNMPAEEDNANAVKLEIDIPTNNPIANVSIEPKIGWTYTVENTPLAQPITTDDGTVTQAISKITWTATNGGLKPGEFDEFDISAGPLPDNTNQIEFKALQTYSNGDIVRWIDDTPVNGPEPDHPAPVLKLTPATSGSTSASANYAKKSATNTALTIGLVGLVVGVVALIVAIAAILRRKA
jgi:periplasmic copper chaperone A